MTITDLVAPEAILPALKVNSKKQALQELSARAAELTGQNERAVFEVLLQREKLGTTAVGYGVAIPHGKLPKLEKLFGLFARLERPIDFEAMDGQPVDLVFLLLAPEGAGADHLKALARIARLLRDQDVAKKLRASRDAQAIYSVLALPPASGRNPTFLGTKKYAGRSGRSGRLPAYCKTPCVAQRRVECVTSARGEMPQCTLTACNSLLQAFAIAASRLSVSMIGVPSAAWSANSFIPGARSGACGKSPGTSSERICFT